jgi:hypothetical protein
MVAVATVSGLAAILAVGAARHVRPVDADGPLRVWRALALQTDQRRALVDYALGGQGGLLGDLVVSIDGRADRYGGERIDKYSAMVKAAPGWESSFAEYPGTTDVVVLSDSGLIDLLLAKGWSQACRDGSYTWLTAPGVTQGTCAGPT